MIDVTCSRAVLTIDNPRFLFVMAGADQLDMSARRAVGQRDAERAP